MRDPSENRPAGVTIIAWLSILGGAMSIISIPQTLRMQNDPETKAAMERMPTILQDSYKKQLEYGTPGILATGVIAALNLPIGFFLLKGVNAARIGYAGLVVVGSIVALALGTPIVFLIFGWIFNGIFLFFLFNRKANDYFRGTALID